MEIKNFINNQCISFGITINWNWKPSVEISFWKWNIEFESTIVNGVRKLHKTKFWNLMFPYKQRVKK